MKINIQIKVTSTNKPSEEAINNTARYLLSIAKERIKKDTGI